MPARGSSWPSSGTSGTARRSTSRVTIWPWRPLRCQHSHSQYLVYFGGSSRCDRRGRRPCQRLPDLGEPPGSRRSKDQAGPGPGSSGVRRTVHFRIRLHIIGHNRSDQAWAKRPAACSRSPPKIEAAQAGLATSQSEGQRRQRREIIWMKNRLVVAPNLWAGLGLVGGGAGDSLGRRPRRGRQTRSSAPAPSGSTSSCLSV